MNKNGKINPIVTVGLYLFGAIFLFGLINYILNNKGTFLSEFTHSILFWIAIIVIVVIIIYKSFSHIQFNKNKIAGWLFILAGLASFIFSIYQFNKTKLFIASEVETSGSVVSIWAHLTGGKTKTDVDTPTIKFKDSTGRTFIFLSDQNLNPGSVKVGDSISIVYNKNDPNEAHLNSKIGIWANTISSFILSLFMFFMSWVMFMSIKKHLI